MVFKSIRQHLIGVNAINLLEENKKKIITQKVIFSLSIYDVASIDEM
jgi:hypothetical protein